MTMFCVPPGDGAGRNAVSIGFSASLDSRTVDRIADSSRTVRFRRAQVIEPAEDESLPALILRSGTIKISHTLIDGRQQIVDFLSAGDVLICWSNGHGNPQTAEVLADVEACALDLAEPARLEASVPGLVADLLVAALGEIGRKNRQVMMLGRKRSDERVATFLLDYSDRVARDGRPVDRFRLPMSRVDIADYLSLTAETISRALTVLREEGMVELPRPDEVVLRDRGRLAHVAAGGADLTVR